MSKKIKKLLNNKYFIVALVALLIVLVIGTGTYAWLTWSSPNTTKLTVKIGNIADVIFDNGKEINTTSLAPVFTYDQGEKTSFSIVKRSTAASTNIDYTITLNITSIAAELKVASFKYVLLNGNQVVRQGNFSSASSGDAISLNSSTLTDTRADFTFYIYIDGNTENNANMMNKEFKATINVSASEGSSGPTMAQYILDLYNNNITGTFGNPKKGTPDSYEISSIYSLMNDRLGITTSEMNGGNTRYYGANPDNYIYFNCDAYPDDACETWRIIGVFDGKVKIIRQSPISSTRVPMQYNSNGEGNWKTSDVGNIFNNSENGCQTYFNYEYDSSQSCSIDTTFEAYNELYPGFVDEVSTNAVKNDITKRMIVAFPRYAYQLSTILFGGSGYYIEDIYRASFEDTDTTDGDIYVGILDIIDYGYASDFSDTCADGIEGFEDIANCGLHTWLYNQSNFSEYFMNADRSIGIVVKKGGTINAEVSLSDLNSIYRPVVYLDSNVKFVGGSGTEGDPYMISP